MAKSGRSGRQRQPVRNRPAAKQVPARPASGTITTVTAPRQPKPATRRPRDAQTFAEPLAVAAIVLLLATPVVIIPGGLDRFVFGKLLVAAVGIALGMLATPIGRFTREVRIVLGVASLALVVSALTSDAPYTAIFGRAPRNEGIFILTTYLLAAVVGARLLGPGRARALVDRAMQTMAAAMLLIAFVAVLESAGLRPLSSNLNRPGSLLGNASDEGGLAVLFAGPLIVSALRRRQPVVVAGAAASLLTVVLSASRGALIGIVVVLVLVAASVRQARKPVLGAAVGVGVLVLAVPYTRDRILGISPLAGHTASGRLLLWKESLKLFAHNWLFGVGPSQFENAVVREHDFTWQHEVGPDNPPGSPHNVVLQVLSAGGVVLLVAMIALAVYAVRAAVAIVRTPDDALLLGSVAGLGGFFATLQFNLTSPGTVIPACVLGGAVLATRREARSQTDRALGWLAATAGVALAVLFLLASVAEIYLKQGSDDLGRNKLAAADSAFGTARALRFWDADLSGSVFHDYVARATAGDQASVPYAQKWQARAHRVADDEQIAQNRAGLLVTTQQYAAAAKLLDEFLSRDPYDPQLLVLRGVVYAQANDTAGAERALSTAVRVDPTNAQAWQDLSIVYAHEGRTADAAAARAKATQYAKK